MTLTENKTNSLELIESHIGSLLFSKTMRKALVIWPTMVYIGLHIWADRVSL